METQPWNLPIHTFQFHKCEFNYSLPLNFFPENAGKNIDRYHSVRQANKKLKTFLLHMQTFCTTRIVRPQHPYKPLYSHQPNQQPIQSFGTGRS